jgi:hypothetical protein
MYTLKDFYSIDNMFYFSNLNGIWVDKEEAQQIIDAMNDDLEWEDQQAQREADLEDFNFGL